MFEPFFSVSLKRDEIKFKIRKGKKFTENVIFGGNSGFFLYCTLIEFRGKKLKWQIISNPSLVFREILSKLSILSFVVLLQLIVTSSVCLMKTNKEAQDKMQRDTAD